jgi:hypothetical protein
MLNRLTHWLLLIIVIELVLGGGRLISFGTVSLRMILFALAMPLTLFHLWKGHRIEKRNIVLLFVFTGMLGVGIAAGLISGAEKNLIWEDVKPLMFFYLLPFFGFAINSNETIKKISITLITSSTFMTLVFLMLLALIALNILPFIQLYNIAYPTGEFFFRGEYSFYYKGFIYLCIGLIFVQRLHGENRWGLLSILLVAILSCFTRGLIFALALTYAVYFLYIKRYYKLTILALLVCGTVVFFGKEIYASISEQLFQITENKIVQANPALSDKLLGDREFSDNARYQQIREVVASITPISLILGHGFGNGVASRPVHMEIAYLEIFHKQGLIGIGVWVFLILSLVSRFKKAIAFNPPMATAFFLSALFVFFQSLTNQYINNPIGMGMFLIALTTLDFLSGNNQSSGIETEITRVNS